MSATVDPIAFLAREATYYEQEAYKLDYSTYQRAEFFERAEKYRAKQIELLHDKVIARGDDGPREEMSR